MKCASCDFDNREEIRFCTCCGGPLFLLCIKCGFPATENDRFCGDCGMRLLAASDLAQALPVAPPAARPGQAPAMASPVKADGKMESERRNVTVLFGDISGFTAMSEKLDPEDVSTVMNGCLKMLANIVVRYEGYVDKFIGDCIMALFGAPITHENDPELAVRAAIDMHKEIEEYNKTIPVKLEKPLMLHIGINTGIVIAGGVGSDQKMEYTVMGDTVNLASRLESNAANGQTYVSGYTYNLTRSLFEYNHHDPIKVKGKKDPVAVYEVVKAKSLKTGDKKGGVIVPLVGRDQEVEKLKECVESMVAGQGQVVFLLSDPGIGKSRIQAEVKKNFKQGHIQVIEGVCLSFARSTSYYVFAEIFKNLFNIDSDDLEASMAEKIGQNLPLLLKLDPETLNQEAREGIVFIGSILGVKLGDDYDIPIAQMSAQEIKIAAFRAVAWFFQRLGKTQPIFLGIEDMHHADGTSVELIAYLFEALKDVSILMFLLMRPVKDHPTFKLPPIARKALEGRCTEITFKHLTAAECDQLMKHLLQTKIVPDSVLELVRKRADGNPLYIEEIIRSLIDDGVVEKSQDGSIRVVKDLDKVTIPGSIHGMISARIDKLQAGLKDVLHMAAVAGTVFKHELIKRLVPVKDIDDRLNLLVDMGMLFESQSFPEIEYSFRNILIQEAAYSTLLIKKRKQLHAQVAREIESLFESRLDDQFEVLAHHYQEADDKKAAYFYLVKSGLKAKAAYANQEAAHYLNQAVELALESKTVTEKIPLEEVYTAISEVRELLGQMEDAIEAREKAIETIGDEFGKADAMRNIGRLQEKRGFKEKSLEIYEKAFELLKKHPDSVAMGKLLMNQSWIMNRMKQFDQAVEKALAALKIFEAHDAREDIAYVYNNLAVFYEHKGDLDKALEYNNDSLKLFIEVSNKRQQANVYLSLGFLHNSRKELEQALEYFDKSFELMERIGNRYGAGTALMSKGRCYIDLNKLDESEITLLRALGIHKDLDLKKKVIANELALGKVYIEKGDNKAAREHLQGAKDIATESDSVSDLGKVAHLEARLLIKEGKKPEEKYQEAIDLFKSKGRERDAKSVMKELEQYTKAEA